MIDMYREEILEHYNNPQNYGVLVSPTHSCEELNESCGDHIVLYISIKDGKVSEVKFTGKGCAISMASISMMTEKIKGKSVDAVMRMNSETVLGELKVPISPSRMKCALLSLKSIHNCVQTGSLNGSGQSASSPSQSTKSVGGK